MELQVCRTEERSTLATGLGRLRFLERAVDLALLLVAFPVILLFAVCIAVAIYLDSPGPVIFKSIRVGRNGKPFDMFKFRKMRLHATGDPLTRVDDERFTPIGRFLTHTHLDELPQVLNVLRGEMRLVGPRPELECFVAQFSEPYAEIVTVTPGITGVAQLSFADERHLLAGADPVGSYRDQILPAKIEIDLAYARRHSLLGDLVILARTIALPFKRLFAGLHWTVVRAWLPTAGCALLLTLVFVLVTRHLQ